MTAYPTLLSPLDLGHTVRRNRVVMGSMHTKLDDRTRDLPKLAAFFAERAKGGTALIVTGGYAPTWRGWLLPFGSQMTTSRQARAHRLVTDAVHGIENLFGIKFLDASVYLMSDLPAEVRLGDVLQVAGVSLLLAALATIYPAWRASRTLPAEALRHE